MDLYGVVAREHVDLPAALEAELKSRDDLVLTDRSDGLRVARVTASAHVRELVVPGRGAVGSAGVVISTDRLTPPNAALALELTVAASLVVRSEIWIAGRLAPADLVAAALGRAVDLESIGDEPGFWVRSEELEQAGIL